MWYNNLTALPKSKILTPERTFYHTLPATTRTGVRERLRRLSPPANIWYNNITTFLFARVFGKERRRANRNLRKSFIKEGIKFMKKLTGILLTIIMVAYPLLVPTYAERTGLSDDEPAVEIMSTPTTGHIP